MHTIFRLKKTIPHNINKIPKTDFSLDYGAGVVGYSVATIDNY